MRPSDLPATTELDVRLITTWRTGCGIAEHSFYLKEAVGVADPAIVITPDPEALDPAAFRWSRKPAILHLNYHAALHSRWDPLVVRRVRDRGIRIVITYHDTIGEISPAGLRARDDHRLDRLEDLATEADALVVHEPCEGLPDAIYWRMGVPAPEEPTLYGAREAPWRGARAPLWEHGSSRVFKRWSTQPILGSIGFPFPWKNYTELARLTGEIGWALLLIAPTATPDQIQQWSALNPNLLVRADFVPRREAVSLLSGCDATAFAYTCANTAQSAAILQGVAARKPVLAFSSCRQFRALYGDPLGRETIRWCGNFAELAFALRTISIERCDPGIVALAEQESWADLGAKYAWLYRSLET